MDFEIVHGDLLDQKVEAIVNAWNCNFIPWWLLLPQGVSGAIKKRGGIQPFCELQKKTGIMKLGDAVYTSAGKLPYKLIIHVAGINWFWCASEKSIRMSVLNAMELAKQQQIKSLAFPIIGAGSGSFNVDQAQSIMEKTLSEIESDIRVILVRYGD